MNVPATVSQKMIERPTLDSAQRHSAYDLLPVCTCFITLAASIWACRTVFAQQSKFFSVLYGCLLHVANVCAFNIIFEQGLGDLEINFPVTADS